MVKLDAPRGRKSGTIGVSARSRVSMSEVYSTEALIQILEAERRACLRGERLNLTATPFIGNAAVDAFLKPDAVQKFSAFQDFKAAIHDYQQQNGVSGIVWREIVLRGRSLRYPQVDDRLIAIPRDLDVLKGARSSILEFWYAATTGMDLYLSVNQGRDYQKIARGEIEGLVDRTEWANVWKWENATFLEAVLQLGWGQPERAAYRRDGRSSGSEYVHAVELGKMPIG